MLHEGFPTTTFSPKYRFGLAQCASELKSWKTLCNLFNTAISLDKYKGIAMKHFSISAHRSLALALALGVTLGISTTGVAYAQYGTSGQSGSTEQSGSAGKSAPAPSKEGMDSGGYVDGKKRVERAQDKDSQVPEFPRDKDGKPIKDPKEGQGGSIGPN